MKHLPLILWSTLALLTVALLYAGIAIHQNPLSIIFASTLAMLCHTWYKSEIKSHINKLRH